MNSDIFMLAGVFYLKLHIENVFMQLIIYYKLYSCISAKLMSLNMVHLLGIFEATSLERSKRDHLDPQDIPDGTFQSQLQMSPLPS